MQEQGKFIEILEDIKNIAFSQGNKITQEEVKKYIGDMELDDEKMAAVYRYLSASGLTVEGFRYVPDVSVIKEKNDAAKDKVQEKAADVDNTQESTTSEDIIDESRAAINSRQYREEVELLEIVADEQMESMVKEFIGGSVSAKQKLIENHLAHIMELAKNYADREAVKREVITVEDIIAEGNLGLLEKIALIEENTSDYMSESGEPDCKAVLQAVNEGIVQAMERMIDEVTGDKDREDAVLAKTNLLHEAAKYLTEEMGRVPTREELSEYTKVSVSEIKKIMGLSEDAKRVAE